MFKSFRSQLTAWYVMFFALLLASFSGFLYFLLARNLDAHVNASVAGTAEMLVTLFSDELEESGGNPALAASEILREVRLPAAYFAIYDEQGRLLDASPPLRRANLPRTAAVVRLPGIGGHGAKATSRPCFWKSRKFTIAVVEPLDSIAGQLEALRHVFYIALPFAILIAGLVGFLLASKSIAPIASISEQAEFITDKNLHTRLTAPGALQEFSRLASVFNELLSRLDLSFERMRDFMADASHELRTPLAIIRGEADVALAQTRQPAEYRESLAIIQDEAGRLTRLVEDLLNLARADAGHHRLRVEEIYLNDLLEECCRPAQVQARRKGVNLVVPPLRDISFRGDPDLLRRMISNLLDNAIRYTPAGGCVQAGLEVCAGHLLLTVADTGIGIPAESQARIFERFYRVDKARSRSEGGFGLGLSIVKWIVDAHLGQIRVESRPHHGTKFTVRLPMETVAAPDRTATSLIGGSTDGQ